MRVLCVEDWLELNLLVKVVGPVRRECTPGSRGPLSRRIDHDGTREPRRETIISKPLNYSSRDLESSHKPLYYQCNDQDKLYFFT